MQGCLQGVLTCCFCVRAMCFCCCFCFTSLVQPFTNPVSDEELVRLALAVDPRLQLTDDAKTALNEIADDFLDSVTVFSAEIAKHRRDGDALKSCDIALHLEQNWGLDMNGNECSRKRQKVQGEAEEEKSSVVSPTAPPATAAPVS